MRPCKMARFCAILRVFVFFCAFLCAFFLPKWPAEKRKFAHNRAKMCKKRFYAIPPLVIPPFACHRPSLSETREGCGSPKCLAGRVFRPISTSTLLENASPILRQHYPYLVWALSNLSEHGFWKIGPAFRNASKKRATKSTAVVSHFFACFCLFATVFALLRSFSHILSGKNKPGFL